MIRRFHVVNRWRLSALLGAVVAAVAVVAAGTAASGPTVVAQGLDDPRGIDASLPGPVTAVQTDTGAITEVSSLADPRTVATLPGAVDVALGGFLNTQVVTGGGGPPDEGDEEAAPAAAGAPPPASLLRVLGHGRFTVIADIGAYQQTDPDPDDQDDFPEESNPNGLALLPRGAGTLVADAANNDLLLVNSAGRITTVARFKREVVPMPEIDDAPPDFPPAGTPLPAEAVPTAVAIGPDGAWYVSELKGFPFAPGTSRIWRIEPGSKDATCDPEHPDTGPCTTFADGFTAVIDLRFGGDGTLYVLEIAKDGLLPLELGSGNPAGALFALKNGVRTEIAPGQLLVPGGVGIAPNGTLYVTTGTVFGPGAGSIVAIRP
jgi:hypothetical protein